MKNLILGIVVLVIVAGGVGAFMWAQHDTPQARRERLEAKFVSILPDSLESYQIEEINKLFETLWSRHDRGLVAQADIDTITTEMQDYVDAGHISGTELVHLMAEVGYKTYSGEAKYRLPSGVVDHPVLNPKSAMVDLLPDTAGFADWLADRKRKEQEAEAAKKQQEQKKPQDAAGGQGE